MKATSILNAKNQLSFNSRLAKKGLPSPTPTRQHASPAQLVFGSVADGRSDFRPPGSSSGGRFSDALFHETASQNPKDTQRANICPNEILESPPKVNCKKQMKYLKTATALMSQEFCE